MTRSKDFRQVFRNLLYPERIRGLDVEEWVGYCAGMGATGVCLDIKSQAFALYASRFLEKDPLLGARDLAAELSTAARRHGLKWCAYIAPYQQEELRETRREWQERLEDGSVFAESGPGFLRTMFCWNSPYREFLCEVLKEIASRYRPDSFYIDGMRFHRQQDRLTCYCAYCQARFRGEHGLALPLSSDGDNAGSRKAWTLFLKARRRWMAEATAALRAAVDSVDPGIVFYLNNKFGGGDWSSTGSPAQFRSVDHLCRELIPQCVRGSLPYAPYGFSAGDLFLWECATQRAAVQGRAGQLYLTLSPVARPEDIRLTLDLACAVGAQVALQERRSETREFLARLKMMEPYFRDATPLAEVAVHYSEEAVLASRPGEGSRPFQKEAAGLYKMLLDLHRPVEVVLDEDLSSGDYRGAPLVVLPESDALSGAARKHLIAHLQSGGSVLAVRTAGALGEDGAPTTGGLIFPDSGLSVQGEINTRKPFGIRMESGRLVREDVVSADPAQYLVFHQGSVRDWLGEEIAVRGHPEVCEERELFQLRDVPSVYLPSNVLRVRADDRWTVLASLRYRDAVSGEWENSPAVLSRKVGRGTLLYTAFALGSLFKERSLWYDIGYAWSRALVAHLLNEVVGPSRFRIEAPGCVKVTFWRAGRKTYIHLVNELSGYSPVVPLEERLPVRGRVVLPADAHASVETVFGAGQGCRTTLTRRGWTVAFRGLKDRLLIVADDPTVQAGKGAAPGA